MEQWYALYTKPNAEYQVARTFQNRRIQTHLPEIWVAKARNQYEKKPFFPCYLFIKVDLDVVGLSYLQWTPGLRRMVSFFNDKPVPVPAEIIELLGRKLGEIETGSDLSTSTFKPGETVRVINGPFRDMLAIFDGPTTPSERVQVLLNILGHANRVQVDAANLEKGAPGDQVLLPKRPRRTRGRGRRIKMKDSPLKM